MPAVSKPKCDNPNALGVERIVQIDTTGGPGFGFEHFKAYDFLRDKEVVLTFDDGPWPGNTERVLKALADNCTKATVLPDRQACRLASGNPARKWSRPVTPSARTPGRTRTCRS